MSAISKAFTQLKTTYAQRPKYQRYLGIMLTIYLLFCALLGLLSPYILKTQIPTILSEQLQRPVKLNDITINPFTFDVTLTGFALKETDKTDFVGFESFSFEMRFWHSLFNQALSIKHVTLTEAYAFPKRVTHSPELNSDAENDALQFNFSDIITRLSADMDETELRDKTNTSTDLPHVIVNNIAIIDADFTFTDEVTNSELDYPNISVNIQSFDTLTHLENGGKSNQFAIKLIGQKGGQITTSGQLQLEPLNIQGELSLLEIQLPQFWSFVSSDFQAKLKTGQFDFTTQFELNLDSTPDVPLVQLATNKGYFSLDNIEFTHDAKQLITMPHFEVTGIALNLSEQRVSIDSIASQSLVLNATITEDGVDLLPLFIPSFLTQAGDVTHSDVENAKENKPSWSGTINEVAIKDYSLNLNETILTNSTLWTIHNIDVSTKDITTDLSQDIDYSVSLAVNNQGRFSAGGSVNINQQHLEADIAVSKFVLEQLQPYIAPYINVTLKKGDVSAKGKLTVETADNINFIGDVQVESLLVKDNLHQTTLLKWQQMAVSQLALNTLNQQVAIKSIHFSQPFSRIVIAEDKSTNIQDLLIAQPAASQPSPSESLTDNVGNKPPLEISINTIRFNDGSTFFADNSLTPNFAASIEQLEGSIDKLSSTSKHPAKIDIKGKIDKYAPVLLKGELNPLLDMPYLNLDLSFDSVELTSVNPYSGTYAGYYIDKGLLSLELSYLLENNKLQGSNHMVVNQLTLGKPSDSSLATSLPVTLAIALLQDRHGVIDLGLDVSGDLDSPSFSFGSIIMTAFTNVITKAVTAPFSLLAGLFGDDEALDKITFSPGASELSPPEKAKLSTLSKALLDRPKLNLNIEGAVDVIADSRELQVQMLADNLARISQIEASELPIDLSASTFPTEGPLSEALITLYERDLGKLASELKNQINTDNAQNADITEQQLSTQWHIAMYNLNLQTQKVGENLLGNLASERARTIKAHLIEFNQIPPSRIFLLDSRINLNQGASEALLTLGAE